MSRRASSAGFGALLAVSGCVSGSGSSIVVVLCGDSTMAAYAGKDRLAGWGEALPRVVSPQAVVINRAIPGATAASFVWNGLEGALAIRADVAIVQFGHNPADSAVEAKALAKIAKAFGERGAKTVFVTQMEGRDMSLVSPSQNSGLREVASNSGIPLVPLDSLSHDAWRAAGADSMASYFVDPIHLSPLGAWRVASLVASRLERIVPELAR